MSARGGRCQEVTKLIMVDLEGVAELEVAADLVLGVELIAETLEASNATTAINSASGEDESVESRQGQRRSGDMPQDGTHSPGSDWTSFY